MARSIEAGRADGALMLMDLHGWAHETAFAQYLTEQSDLVDALGFKKRPDQATLWRARRERFSDEFLDAITACVRSIQVLASENRVSVPPRKTDCTDESDAPRPWEQPADDDPSQREIIQRRMS